MGHDNADRVYRRSLNRVIDDVYLSYQKSWMESLAASAEAIYALCHGGRPRSFITDPLVPLDDALRVRRGYS